MRDVLKLYADGLALIIDDSIMNGRSQKDLDEKWGWFDKLFYNTFFKEEKEEEQNDINT